MLDFVDLVGVFLLQIGALLCSGSFQSSAILLDFGNFGTNFFGLGMSIADNGFSKFHDLINALDMSSIIQIIAIKSSQSRLLLMVG